MAIVSEPIPVAGAMHDRPRARIAGWVLGGCLWLGLLGFAATLLGGFGVLLALGGLAIPVILGRRRTRTTRRPPSGVT